MNSNKLQIIETLVTLLVYIVSFFVTKNIIDTSLKKAQLERTRRKLIIKAINLFMSIVVLVLIAVIWGVEQNKITLFASTILTAFGIAFFVQWSLLSNITSSIILFFNQTLRLGDTIKFFDKDFQFEGEVKELTCFSIHFKILNGEIITIPNSIILHKSILVIRKKD